MKVGDKVKVLRKPNKNDIDRAGWTAAMDKYIGKVYTIQFIGASGDNIRLAEDTDSWWFPISVLKKVED